MEFLCVDLMIRWFIENNDQIYWKYLQFLNKKYQHRFCLSSWRYGPWGECTVCCHYSWEQLMRRWRWPVTREGRHPDYAYWDWPCPGWGELISATHETCNNYQKDGCHDFVISADNHLIYWQHHPEIVTSWLQRLSKVKHNVSYDPDQGKVRWKSPLRCSSVSTNINIFHSQSQQLIPN